MSSGDLEPSTLFGGSWVDIFWAILSPNMAISWLALGRLNTTFESSYQNSTSRSSRSLPRVNLWLLAQGFGHYCCMNSAAVRRLCSVAVCEVREPLKHVCICVTVGMYVSMYACRYVVCMCVYARA